jgi:S-sulfosulfanyl-L-cysteine sulfohydrolase
VGTAGDNAYARKGGDGGTSDATDTIIHMGDLHDHTMPRPNLRSDGEGRMEGGLACMYTEIKNIRAANPNSLFVNTGDTIQGSGEAMYSRGQPLVDVDA